MQQRRHVRRRSKFEIYGDILRAIREDRQATSTRNRISARANLQWDRMKDSIGMLVSAQLLSVVATRSHDQYVITPKGYAFLRKYDDVERFMAEYGLLEEESR